MNKVIDFSWVYVEHMPKNTQKKERRREKARRYAIRTQKQRQRNKLLAALRSQKQANLTLNTGSENLGWTPSPNIGKPVVVNEPVNENGNNGLLPVNFNRFNVNVPGATLKQVARKKTLKQQKKANLLRNRSRKQREREQAIRRQRGFKEEERELVEADSPDNELYFNNEELAQMERNEYEKELQEKYELEQKYKKKQYKEAKKKFYEAKPNTFYIRFNKHEPFLKASEVFPRMKEIWHGFSLEIFYKGTGLKNSFYYYFQKDEPEEYYDNDNISYNSLNNDYFGMGMGIYGYGHHGYHYRRRAEESWSVVKADPVEFFKPIHTPKYYGWGGDEWYFYRAPPGPLDATFYSTFTMRDYIKSIPGFMEKVQREKQAVFTAPPKLETLQLKAAEAAAEQFEEATGRHVPQNVRNQIEGYLRKIYKPTQRYYQTRDNLYKINTSLFTNN